MTKLKINTTFESIQGEGRYTGKPCSFIRVSGCNKQCDFCDTKYHKNVLMEWRVRDLIHYIRRCEPRNIIFTGGEPLLQKQFFEYFFSSTQRPSNKRYHVETNGSVNLKLARSFDFISFSPKCLEDAKKIVDFINKYSMRLVNYEIKIVTDLKKVNIDLLEYATTVMPLTTGNELEDKKIGRKVWFYCIDNQIDFSPRLQQYYFNERRDI